MSDYGRLSCSLCDTTLDALGQSIRYMLFESKKLMICSVCNNKIAAFLKTLKVHETTNT